MANSSGGERNVAFIVLLALVFLTAAFYRDFAHIAILVGGTKLYITELSIAVVLLLLLVEVLRTGVVSLRLAPSAAFVLLFIIWGTVCLYRGRSDIILSLREFATNYYSVFYLLVAVLANTPGRLRLLASTIFGGTILAFAVVLLRVIVGEGVVDPTGLLRVQSSVTAVGAAAFFCLAAPAATSRRRVLFALGVLVSVLVAVVASLSRSAALAMGATSLAWVGWFHVGRGRGSIGSQKAVALGIVVVVILIAVVPHFGNQTATRLVSVGTVRENANSKWRLALWAHLASRLESSPLVGHGFGHNLPAFQFRGHTYGFDPSVVVGVHNSFLFVLYKEGLVGLVLLLGFAGSVLYRCTRALGETAHSPYAWIASASLSGFVFLCVFACFNVVLEGPYMGMLFWIFAGLAEAALILGSETAGSRQLTG